MRGPEGGIVDRFHGGVYPTGRREKRGGSGRREQSHLPVLKGGNPAAVTGGPLCDEVVDDLAFDVGEPEVAPGVAVGEALVVEA